MWMYTLLGCTVAFVEREEAVTSLNITVWGCVVLGALLTAYLGGKAIQ